MSPLADPVHFWYPANMTLRWYQNGILYAVLLTVFSLVASRAQAQTAVQVYSEGMEAYKQGNADLAKRKLALALEIDKNFRPASALLNRINSDQRAGGAIAPGMSAKTLERTVVPVEFKDTTLTSALEFLRQRADETTGGKLKINFAVNLPPELANKRVTLKLDRVPVSEVLKYIGELAGVSFQVQPYAIVVTPAVPTTAPAASPAP